MANRIERKHGASVGLLPGPHLIQQLGVPVEHHEQFHQCERRLCLPVLVARKRIGAAAKDRGRLPLVERELLLFARLGGFQHAHFDA